ncbi:hypothetical protein [Nitrosomonas sp. wSCUT-2]
MFSKKLSDEKFDGASNTSDIDDEGVLADGMIPDSRIVKLIDELEISHDDSGGESPPEITQNNLKPAQHNDK